MVSQEFHDCLADTQQSLEEEGAKSPEKIASPRKEVTPKPKEEPKEPKKEPVKVEETPEPAKPEEKVVEKEEPAKPEEKEPETKQPEPTKEPEPTKVSEKPTKVETKEPVVKESAEEIAARAKNKAAALLRNKMKERGDLDSQRRADDAVNDLIFERVRSLQSLVDQEIPLQSVYSLVNVNDMTSAACSLVKAAIPTTYGQSEIAALNNALKASADALKNLFTVVKKFASLFGDEDKKEVLSNALTLQGTVKSLIAIIKQLNGKPNDETLRENLLSTTKQMVDTVYKFFKACEVASLEYVSTTSQSAAEQITKIIEAGSGTDKDGLDEACKTAAFTTLKLSQLIKTRASQSCVKNVRVGLNASASIIERTTLELINECKKLWAQGLKPNEDTNNLAKKILLEYRQVNNNLQKPSSQTNHSLTEQGDQFNQLAGSVSEIIQQLSEINFSSDLDKALVLQMKLIGRKLENLDSIDSMEGKTIISIANEIVEALKKIRVGMAAMEKKSRDQALNRRLKVWAESLLNFMLAIRLSVSSLLLKLPIEGELQLSVKVDGAVVQCSEFYQFLIELRSA